ncbi:MAG TPA: TerB N-terminal domain-containing protein [Mycobacteriales bacterium]|nr:TerB N-terminal domain-containing protein [Mycobacteriales bacterium]
MPFGQAVNVGGLTLYGGLLNVGPRLQSLSQWRGDEPEPSLIKPTLKINMSNPDDAGAGVGYWASYSNLSPETRAGYLRWLAEGRNRPGGPIGFMFLYFYGLERRLLVDMHQAGTVATERPVLINEVQRLLDLYGDHSSVRRYLSGLLTAVTPLDGPRRYLGAPTPAGYSWEMPFDTALGLGQLVTDGKAIPTAWAQAWWQSHPDSHPRTAVQRCPPEFAEVFAALYTKQFGEGLVLKPNKKMLSWQYRPASPSMNGGITVTADVPDVRTLKGPFNKLATIAEQATDSLDAYSRHVRKNPLRTLSPHAIGLLPPEVQRVGDADTTALLEYAAAMVEGYTERSVRLVELTSRWGSPSFVRADADALARLLERHSIGIEPDVRFGGPVPKPDSRVALFRRGDSLTSAPTPAYLEVVSLVQLAGAVAAADGPVRENEMDTLVEHVSRGAGLSADEQARLRAHLLWVSEHPPTPAALRKRVDLLDDNQKEQAARLLVAVAAADGQITPAEIDVLARLFVVLGFQSTDAYAQVHALAAGQGQLRKPTVRPVADPLAPAKTSGQPSPGFALPPRESALGVPAPSDVEALQVFALDPELLAKTRQSSEQVATLLAGIFTEDEPVLPAPEPAAAASDDEEQDTASGPPLVGGLDAAHSDLLRVLAGRRTWSHADFTAVCAEHALLPDGARDTLNETALDVVGDLVCEGTDPIDMNSDALQEML